MRTLVLIALGASLLFATPAEAVPQEPPEQRATPPEKAPPEEITEMARTFYESGVQAYEKGDFPTALRAFESAFGTLPSPEFQFNIARCHERLGHWGAAASAYQQYLHGKANAPDADEIRMRIAELSMREREAEAARTSLHPTAPPTPARPARTLRIAAASLLGATLALGGAGTGAYLSEWSEYTRQRDACQSMCSPASLDGLRTRVELARLSGGILWGLAGAALVADVVLWIVDARARREHAPSTAMSAEGWRF